jgi:hypothetical protein
MFIGPFVEPFAKAEQEYRREQIAAQFRRPQRPFHLRWPVGLTSPTRRRPRHTRAGRPAPQHVSPGPQHVSPAPQHVSPAPQHVTPAPQHVSRLARTTSR